MELDRENNHSKKEENENLSGKKNSNKNLKNFSIKLTKTLNIR